MSHTCTGSPCCNIHGLGCTFYEREKHVGRRRVTKCDLSQTKVGRCSWRGLQHPVASQVSESGKNLGWASAGTFYVVRINMLSTAWELGARRQGVWGAGAGIRQRVAREGRQRIGTQNGNESDVGCQSRVGRGEPPPSSAFPRMPPQHV